MKRPFIIFAIFIVFFAHAQDIDLNFYVDGDKMQTNVSSCSVGSEFTLPTAPAKYGYDFVGWAEIFYRGTFSDWVSVPNIVSSYLADIHDNQTPQQYDYIIVNDASGIPRFGKKIVIDVYSTQYTSYWNGYCHTYIDGKDWGCGNSVTDGTLTIENSVYAGLYGTRFMSPTESIFYNGSVYASGSYFLTLAKDSRSNGTYIAYFIKDYPYSGKWICRYNGVWSENTKSGWVPEKQIND